MSVNSFYGFDNNVLGTGTTYQSWLFERATDTLNVTQTSAYFEPSIPPAISLFLSSFASL